MLHPTFHLFKEMISGTIAGTVSDTLGAPFENIVIEAVSATYSTSTLTDSLGQYLLTLPMETYNISTVLDTTMSADTSYSDVVLNAGDFYL